MPSVILSAPSNSALPWRRPIRDRVSTHLQSHPYPIHAKLRARSAFCLPINLIKPFAQHGTANRLLLSSEARHGRKSAWAGMPCLWSDPVRRRCSRSNARWSVICTTRSCSQCRGYCSVGWRAPVARMMHSRSSDLAWKKIPVRPYDRVLLRICGRRVCARSDRPGQM